MPAFVACNENKAAFAKKTTTAIACRAESCVAKYAHRWGLTWHETNKKAATVGM